jgi:hypothetical protein
VWDFHSYLESFCHSCEGRNLELFRFFEVKILHVFLGICKKS